MVGSASIVLNALVGWGDRGSSSVVRGVVVLGARPATVRKVLALPPGRPRAPTDPGVAAATILGDGQIALILDPADLVRAGVNPSHSDLKAAV